MRPIVAATVTGLCVAVSVLGARAAHAREDADAQTAKSKQAYKPAQRRDAQAAADNAAPADAAPAGVSDPAAFEKEIQAAKEQRDRDLKDAANETDRKKFDKRKEEIFARYAAIVAAMRDKYAAAQADAEDTPQRPGKSPRPGAVRLPASEKPDRPEARSKPPRREEDDAQADIDPPAPRKNAKPARPGRGRGDDAGTLDEAQKRLEDETARHDAEMEKLNRELTAAQTSANKREIRKAERAIEKENNAFDAKKAILERRVSELGGGATGAPAGPSRSKAAK